MRTATLRIQAPPPASAAAVSRVTTSSPPSDADPRVWAFAMAQGAALCRL